MNKRIEELLKVPDLLEEKILKWQFLQEVLDSLTDIKFCDNCGKLVWAKGKYNNHKVEWWRKGAYQSGTFKGRMGLWCSTLCQEQDQD